MFKMPLMNSKKTTLKLLVIFLWNFLYFLIEKFTFIA